MTIFRNLAIFQYTTKAAMHQKLNDMAAMIRVCHIILKDKSGRYRIVIRDEFAVHVRLRDGLV
jgi:hypothetical protein